MNAERIYKQKKGTVVNFPSRKLKKDGTAKNIYTPDNQDRISRVHPFKTEEEIRDVILYYENKMINSKRSDHKLTAGRNVMLITVGINLGIRASDLLSLKWKHVFRSGHDFIEEDDDIEIREKKTKKIKGLIFNQACKDAIMNYINTFDIETKPESYIFKSRESGAITVRMCSSIIQEAAEACGIKRRIGSHTLRKTFAYFQIKAHNNNSTFINHLQHLLNHSSQDATMSYSDITSEKLKELHNDVNLGKQCVIKAETSSIVHVNKEDFEYLLKNISKDIDQSMLKYMLEKYGFTSLVL